MLILSLLAVSADCSGASSSSGAEGGTAATVLLRGTSVIAGGSSITLLAGGRCFGGSDSMSCLDRGSKGSRENPGKLPLRGRGASDVSVTLILCELLLSLGSVRSVGPVPKESGSRFIGTVEALLLLLLEFVVAADISVDRPRLCVTMVNVTESLRALFLVGTAADNGRITLVSCIPVGTAVRESAAGLTPTTIFGTGALLLFWSLEAVCANRPWLTLPSVLTMGTSGYASSLTGLSGAAVAGLPTDTTGMLE